LEVVAGVVSGKQDKEVASDLHISRHCVRMHLHNVYRRLRIAGRHDLLVWALQHDLVKVGDLRINTLHLHPWMA
jgi:two-component system nitrate/nitrite response regulator NarL